MVDHRLTDRRVLVTGATGFLGTHLVHALRRVGAKVYALRRKTDSVPYLASEGVTWLVADITNLDSLKIAVQSAEPEIVFHLAAYGTTSEQNDEYRAFCVNVKGSLNLWWALEGFSCRLVHTGTCGEYGQVRGQVTEKQICEPTWFYPATKNASVVLLSSLGRASRREVVTLRPFGPFGPADNNNRVIPYIILSLLSGQTVEVTEGKQLRDYSYVDNHVSAYLLAATQPLKHSGVVYNIGSGKVISLRYLIETIADLVGGNAIERVRFGAKLYRRDELWEMCCSIQAAQDDLGYTPTIALEEGMRRTVAWYKTRAKYSNLL